MSAPPLTPLATAVLRVPRAPERVLAIAPDGGEAALFLAREFPTARVRGVDPSPRRARDASGRIGLDPDGRIAFKPGGPRQLPYPDAFFDLVAVVDLRPAGDLARVLSPGAHLILAWTRPPRGRLGRHAGWSPRQLQRHDLELVERAEAGSGSFTIARRRARSVTGDDE